MIVSAEIDLVLLERSLARKRRRLSDRQRDLVAVASLFATTKVVSPDELLMATYVTPIVDSVDNASELLSNEILASVAMSEAKL